MIQRRRNWQVPARRDGMLRSRQQPPPGRSPKAAAQQLPWQAPLLATAQGLSPTPFASLPTPPCRAHPPCSSSMSRSVPLPFFYPHFLYTVVRLCRNVHVDTYVEHSRMLCQKLLLQALNVALRTLLSVHPCRAWTVLIKQAVLHETAATVQSTTFTPYMSSVLLRNLRFEAAWAMIRSQSPPPCPPSFSRLVLPDVPYLETPSRILWHRCDLLCHANFFAEYIAHSTAALLKQHCLSLSVT